MTRNKEAQAAMSARKLFYLGPQGTFTHQAAVNAAQELARLEPQGFDLMPMDDVPATAGESWPGRTTSKGTWCPTSTR